jgi:hypothetical protein
MIQSLKLKASKRILAVAVLLFGAVGVVLVLRLNT